MTEEEISKTREKYINFLQPLFLPPDPQNKNVINYFASLLRIVGMEDKGWDPHLESRAILENLNSILQMDLPENSFPDNEWTKWRVGLLMYSHIVEMDAPYEVLTNLLRFKNEKGYSPNPFLLFLTDRQKKSAIKYGLNPKQKIGIIKELSSEAGINVGDIFDEIYNPDLRNAISHSDYILSNEGFRSRGGTINGNSFTMSLENLGEILVKSRIFMSTFFALESKTRNEWGKQKHKGIPFDPNLKALIEFLVNGEDQMCGFKIHWPNNSDSVYRRTEDGIEMTNCDVDMGNATISFSISSYAREPSSFSPLIEKNDSPTYSELENGVIPEWKN
ncbi:MAG: hypothetical protein HOJ79_15220 [Nitrospina sp.]|jgi:hypothetical protein|nr:hypothetical protein [Nitrospina sp.]